MCCVVGRAPLEGTNSHDSFAVLLFQYQVGYAEAKVLSNMHLVLGQEVP